MLQIKDHFSPNADQRPVGVAIDTLIIHYTGMPTGDAALSRMCDAQAKVSAHYMVEEDGTIFRLVPEEKQAWHAGISCWGGKAALNENSIGIEVVNPGHEFGYRKFPKIQMDALLNLCQNIIARHSIEPNYVVGHADVAPTRKEDPGELFDWHYLARHGVGLWVDNTHVKHAGVHVAHPGDESVTVASFQKLLLRYGYHIRVDGFYGNKTEAIIRAFKRHFIQDQVNAFWDNRAQFTIEQLVERVEVQG